eukprot:5953685-Pyramimonas_sp.AAC.1
MRTSANSKTSAEKNGWGLCLTLPGEEDLTLGGLCFADNVWILARSASMAAEMTEARLRILNKSGLE